MTDVVFQVVGVLCAAAILVKAEPCLNRVTSAVPLKVRAVLFLLVISAVALGGGILFMGYVPAWPAVLVSASTAGVLHLDRRKGLFDESAK